MSFKIPNLAISDPSLLRLGQDVLDVIYSHSKLQSIVALYQTCKSFKYSICIVMFKANQLIEDLSDVFLMANEFVKYGDDCIKTATLAGSCCSVVGYSRDIYVCGTLRHEAGGYIEPRVPVTSFRDDWFPLLEVLEQASPLLLGGLQAESVEFSKYPGAYGYNGGPMFRQIIRIRVVFRSDANVKLTVCGDLVMVPKGLIKRAFEDGSMEFTGHRTHVNWCNIHIQCMKG